MGAGKMGIVLAKDLIESDNRNKVTLVDISSKRLQKARKFIESERLILLNKNVEKEKQRQPQNRREGSKPVQMNIRIDLKQRGMEE